MNKLYVLRVNCPDQPGIVAAVSATLYDANCNIEESSQFNDHLSGQFFMRVVYAPVKYGSEQVFASAFKNVAQKFSMNWHITPLDEPVKTLILVSKDDHCLNDLLYRWRTKNLAIDIVGVASNHEINRKLTRDHGLPFHYLPINDKTAQEKQVAAIIKQTDAELIVLARYMQILSGAMCEAYKGRVINIHHSFLPGFKGAKPYHQAFERGVKIIGATAHFATNDLDEGPIIEQETVRVDHAHTPQKMQSLGRDTESRVLARAIGLYAERRIFLQGQRTVIL